MFAYGDQDRYLVPDEVFKAFMTHCNQKIGESYFRTPRNTIKAFLDLLAILEQNPQAQWQGLVNQAEIAPDAPSAGGDIIDDDKKMRLVRLVLQQLAPLRPRPTMIWRTSGFERRTVRPIRANFR